MVKICNYGFDESFIDEHRDIHGIAYTQNVLSGRYKNIILWYLKEGDKRFNEIKKLLVSISQGSLTKQLKELEYDKVISRTVYPEVPPKVVYGLTDKGRDLIPVIDMMEAFGEKYSEDSINRK
ncbi:transcriptional regulator [Staphylococcus gallinarum]|jgi:DNA-binding HxlR family transcriptional regulator|uniref:winged helix-turn-helix transcriptional regulator n=1 Tax=Staphylococcus gallinarum TaxID=1293 RepID=UPI000D1E714A|nr:helix-turn-helix domain-containing protein [Staphylococcus gallinarum]MCD8820216.1 helix-turn-helix transcriptional regulator [Staphylococcus gallinarum]PTL07230.1 transcriptional regulator [Staphylococcus gallinarum]PTL10767.1 transcriptional regulator [Staphylococcus gallinarum]RIL33763.1 transcriptional regulator [Staphylococcus gallinarum]RIO75437.1 transcriptional regulator [Staphylococcus gallinarum]